MEKYLYKFCVYKNNLRDGVQFVKACNTLGDALTLKAWQEYNGGGCCDVFRKRVDPVTKKPLNMYIGDNYHYSEYDL